MYIFGKILGATFGAIMGGQLGFLTGLFVGHLFDRGLAMNEEIMKPNVNISRQVFFKTTFMMMGYIAKSDGRVSEKEIEMARDIMANLNLRSEQKLQAMKYFNIGKSGNFNSEAIMDNFIRNCGYNPQLMQMFIEIQLKAAFVEGIENQYKRNALERLCDKLNVSRVVLDQMQRRSYYYQQHQYHEQPRSSYSERANRYEPPNEQDELTLSYSLLGVEKNATDAVLKKTYRQLMSKNHPDKLVSKGLPEAMIKIATEKTQAIQRAYDIICKSRGIK